MSNVTDTFTGTANSALTTADTGQSWASFGGGTIGRDGSGHATTTAATADAGEVIDSGVPNATYQATAVNGANGSFGLVFRYADALNFWVVQTIGSTLYTRKFVAGVYTDVTNTVTLAANDVYTVIASGTSITVKQNGVTIRTLTDSFNQSATKGGLLARPGAIYDDFSITNEASGGTPDHVAFVQQPAGTTSTNLMSTQPVVQIQDVSNVLVSSSTASVTLSLQTISGSGTLTGTLTKSATAGSVSWTDIGLIGSGSFRLVATSAGITTATSNIFSYTLRASSPYLGLAGDGSDLGATTSAILTKTAVALSGDRRSIAETRYVSSSFSYGGVAYAAYPNEVMDTDTFPTRTGTLRSVNGDAALQAALTAAVPGDWIIVDHASTYTADYTNAFPFKAGDNRPGGNGVIVVMAKAMYDSIDIFTGQPTFLPPKVRVSPSDLPQMPLFSNTLATGSFAVQGNTRGWRFCGLKFIQSPTQSISQHFVALGNGDTGAQSSVAQCPVNIGLDRCYFDGDQNANMKHCVELHCVAGFIQDCLFGDHVKANVNTYSESHVIIGYNGPGPFRIINNKTMGGSQCIFFGGALSACGAPADIEVRYNWMTRPLTWNGAHPTYDGSTNAIKCNFEIKKAVRLVADGNVNENIWQAGQAGAAWLLKSESYGDGPTNGYTRDVVIRDNLSRNAAFGFNIAGVDNVETAQPPQRVILFNNVGRVGAQYFDASANPILGLGLSLDCGHFKNTMVAEGSTNMYISFPNPAIPATNFKSYDNIYAGPDNYGWKCDAVALSTLHTSTGSAPNGASLRNAVQGGSEAAGYPTGNYFPATLNDIVFTDPATGDYSLYNAGALPPVVASIVHAARAALRLAR